MSSVVYPFGTVDVSVPLNSKIAIGSYDGGTAIISYSTLPSLFPETFYETTRVTNAQTLLGVFTADRTVRIEAGVSKVYYSVGTAPTVDIPYPESMTASATPFIISGLSAAQGGSSQLKGGPSSTSANAGGASSVLGGVPGATGIGGAASLTSGAGGATSGASGAVTVASGTTTAGSASATGNVTTASGDGAASAAAVAGGASGTLTLKTGAGGANTGGATGQVGGAGGNLAVTGGVGGATNSTGAHAGGVGGDVNVTAGAGGNATAGTGNGGAGGTITLAPGSGGTSSGGTAGVAGIVMVGGTNPAPLALNVVRSTVSNGGTISAAQTRGGVLYQDASGGAVTMTTRTGTLLAADFPDLATGNALPIYMASNHASNTSTIAGGTDVTLVGSGAITQTGGNFLLIKTAATTFDLVRIG